MLAFLSLNVSSQNLTKGETLSYLKNILQTNIIYVELTGQTSWNSYNSVNVDTVILKFQRATAFKIYLTNPSLRCALFQPIQPMDEKMGDMVETTIFAQWIQRENANICYANQPHWTGYRNKYREKRKKQLERVALQFIPTAVYAYIVGHNTLHETKQKIGL